MTQAIPVPTTTDWVGRIKWTTLARVVALSFLLMFGIAMDLGMGPQPISEFPEIVLYKVITAFFIVSFVSLLGTYLLAERFATAMAWVTLAVDVLLAAALVAITHGTDSVFLFAMPLTVLSGSALLERSGAYAAATACSILLLVLAAVDAQLLAVDLERWTVAWLRSLGPRSTPKTFEVVFSVLVQVAALYGTALLATRFVLELARARARGEQERRELAALRVRYEDVVSSMPDGLATMTSDGRITSSNPAFAQILGVAADAPIGRTLAELLPELEEHTEPIPTETVEIQRPTADAARELTRHPGGREQILAVRFAGLRSPEGTAGSMLLVRDITEVRAREIAHRNRARLAAIGEMAMAIAHEIRNPLASISGAVQMLRGNVEADSTSRELMTIAVRETGQLSAWIGEFLDFARPGQVSPQGCDLLRVVGEKLLAFRQDPRVTEYDIGVEVVADEAADHRLVADEKQLSSLVWNLLTNAMQALLEVEDRRILITVTADEGELGLHVDDSGKGVALQDRAHIFEPFYTTKGEGTGLGLAQVRRVVEQHGGEVTIDKAGIGGASFRVRLPRDPGNRLGQDTADGVTAAPNAG